jgi:hypothetical protein
MYSFVVVSGKDQTDHGTRLLSLRFLTGQFTSGESQCQDTIFFIGQERQIDSSSA